MASPVLVLVGAAAAVGAGFLAWSVRTAPATTMAEHFYLASLLPERTEVSDQLGALVPWYRHGAIERQAERMRAQYREHGQRWPAGCEFI